MSQEQTVVNTYLNISAGYDSTGYSACFNFLADVNPPREQAGLPIVLQEGLQLRLRQVGPKLLNH